MTATSVSLLGRMQNKEEQAWDKFCQIYGPIIFKWLVARGVKPSDAEDIQQMALAQVSEKIGEFDHNGNTGAFRRWLRLIVANRSTTYWREKNNAGRAQGGYVLLDIA